MKRGFYNLAASSVLFSLCLLPLAASIPGAKAEDAKASVAFFGRDSFDPYTPVFTPPGVKLRETADLRFTDLLILDAVRYNPLYLKPGTQMNMGFFSGAGNVGGVVNVLDSINYAGDPKYTGCGLPKPNGGPTNCAIWVKGPSTDQEFPQHFRMIKEHWDERAAAAPGGTVLIYGNVYPNINPPTKEMATRIWGQFSQRYTDMARVFYARTGKKVKVWALIFGTNSASIFARFEFPELQRLEQEGAVEVHCATKRFADWRVAADWTVGTQSPGCMVTRMVADALLPTP